MQEKTTHVAITTSYEVKITDLNRHVPGASPQPHWVEISLRITWDYSDLRADEDVDHYVGYLWGVTRSFERVSMIVYFP